MEWNPITIDDRSLFEEHLQGAQGFGISDLMFTNLYLWRNAKQLRFDIFKDYLLVGSFIDPYHPVFFMPLMKMDHQSAGFDSVLSPLFSTYEAFQFTSLPKDVAERLISLFPPGTEMRANPDRFDYVYRTSDLIRLEGKKYHAKKNWVHQFQKKYSWSFLPLTQERIPQVIETQHAWCKQHQCQLHASLDAEYKGILEILEQKEQLGWVGGLIEVEGKVVAYSIGELLNEEMVVIHVEKASPEYNGAYQMINQQFLMHCWNDVPFVNREEDLGLEGLRRAKKSYHPAYMVEKYSIVYPRTSEDHPSSIRFG